MRSTNENVSSNMGTSKKTCTSVINVEWTKKAGVCDERLNTQNRARETCFVFVFLVNWTNLNLT